MVCFVRVIQSWKNIHRKVEQVPWKNEQLLTVVSPRLSRLWGLEAVEWEPGNCSVEKKKQENESKMQEKQEKAKERMNRCVACCWGMSGANEVIRRVLGFSALRRERSRWSELWWRRRKPPPLLVSTDKFKMLGTDDSRGAFKRFWVFFVGMPWAYLKADGKALVEGDVEYLREGLVNSFSQDVGGDGIQVKKELVFDGGGG